MYNFQHGAWHVVRAQKTLAVTAEESEPLASYFSGVASPPTVPVH